jgi:hypothetical protein
MGRDWADYLPPEQRRQRERRRQMQRWVTTLRERRVLIGICLGIYLSWCLGLLVARMWLAFSLSLLPVLFMPPLAYLAWWLVWKEFNE